MKSVVLKAVAISIVFLASRSALATIFYSGNWSVFGLTNSGAIYADGTTLMPLTEEVDKRYAAETRVGGEVTSIVQIWGGGGRLGISAFAHAYVASGDFNDVAHSTTDAFATLSDTMHLIAPSATHQIRMTFYWKVDGNVSSDVDGERSVANTPADILGGAIKAADWVDVASGATLTFTGTGLDIPPPPLGSGFQNGTWAYAEDIINSRNTFDTHLINQGSGALPITMLFDPGSSSQPYLLTASAHASAYVASSDPTHDGSVIADVGFGHTLTWGGVTSVTDAVTGEPITDWTLTSDSGFDYAHAAVPEPASVSLFVLLIAGRTCFRRR